ncbi:MAG TPA: YbaB/EbfC family nucleoid-associated protein [Dehalococcoidia bacterium]|jgi:DNA-binding YbaB/EbfC family protein|nr:YbaB/EbfC family nucleoid-associated protein [Dehalococcoidia bacterium]HIK89415.1 YbaB/EbfC family nucleoid-associated protein [Dehalococcoidia bacterium]
MMNKNMLKQAQQMQARLAAVQEEIAVARTEASAGGGVVKVSVIGGSTVESITIDPEVVDPEDVEMLQDLILAAINEAMETANKLASDKMSSITGGMNIPGLM